MRTTNMNIITLVENSSSDLCGGEHGLSFYIETKNHKLLMDFGSSDLLLKNSAILGIDLKQVDTCILSHGHYDHAGGILPFSTINPTANIYLTSTAGSDYYNLSHEYEKYIGIDKRILNLSQCVFVSNDVSIDNELFLFTNITGQKYPANGNFYLKEKINEKFVQDSFRHEQCLVLSQGNQKILLSGCAHNGIINILDRYFEIFQSYPDIVISGFHLMQKTAYAIEDIQNIQEIAHELLKTGALFYTGHCTGEDAFPILKEIMGDKLQHLHSGMKIL